MIVVVWLVLLATLIMACRQRMANQPRYEAYEASGLFEDSLAMRRPVEGTISRESAVDEAFLPGHLNGGDQRFRSEAGDVSHAHDETGAGDHENDGATSGQDNQEHTPPGYPPDPDEHGVGGPTERTPVPSSRSVLLRGRERYDIYCAPCHGRAGDGRGMIVERGLRQPPTFHSSRLRQAEDGHFYSVITNGFGAMYSYANRVPPADRWAIIAYIRALQLSRRPDGLQGPSGEEDR